MSERVAIVTGHSKGLGAELARSLLTRGYFVLGLARSGSPELAQAFPDRLTECALDLADSQALAAWLRTPALRDFLDTASTILLINNAGTVQPVGALHQQDPHEVSAAVMLNVVTPLMLSAAVASVGQGKQCRILHISSGAASSAYPGWSVYCASKAALDQHARAVKLDARAGVRICSLAPGVIDTDMQAQIRATPAERFPLRQRFLDLQRQGDLVAPAACATRVIDFLLSEQFGEQPVDDVRNF